MIISYQFTKNYNLLQICQYVISPYHTIRLSKFATTLGAIQVSHDAWRGRGGVFHNGFRGIAVLSLGGGLRCCG